MDSALIGYSGYVGSTLLRQTAFASCYRSTNIQEIDGGSFDTVVCAGAKAQKWIANRDPQADREHIHQLIDRLKTITCKRFVLISTVDVFLNPIGVDEDSPVQEQGLHAYGLHRLELERFVAGHFRNHLIVRLPGLVGPGLRKNAIYDLHHDNNLQAIDSRCVFQFYPMVNLWYDIEIALASNLKLVHLTAEPISMADVAQLGFNRHFENILENKPPNYDMRSKHAALYGGTTPYNYSKRDSIAAIRAYAQSESRSVKAA